MEKKMTEKTKKRKLSVQGLIDLLECHDPNLPVVIFNSRGDEEAPYLCGISKKGKILAIALQAESDD